MPAFTDLPFDVFVCILHYLDVAQFVQLASTCKMFRECGESMATWNVLADNMLQIRPLPVPPLRQMSSLNLNELREATLSAARIESNLMRMAHGSNVHCVARLTHVRCLDLSLDDLTFLTIAPGGRHVLTSDAGRIACWDLDSGSILASYPLLPRNRVIQWRAVDQGSSVMFIVGRTLAAGESFHFVRLRLSNTEVGQPVTAEFSLELIFYHPQSRIQHMSVSEEVIIFLTLAANGEVVVIFLNWRDRTVSSRATTVNLPDIDRSTYALSVLAWLTLDSFSLRIEDRLQPRIFTFPLNFLISHHTHCNADNWVSLYDASAAGTFDVVQPRSEIQLSMVGNDDAILNWRLARMAACRFWSRSARLIDHRLRRPVSEWYLYSDLNDRTRCLLAHTTFHVPDLPVISSEKLSKSDLARTCVASISLFVTGPGMPFHSGKYAIAMDRKHAVWVETIRERSDGGADLALRMCSIPSEEMRARQETPRAYAAQLVRTLPVPEGLDLSEVTNMVLDDAYGIVLLKLYSGTLWVLRF